MLVILWDSLRIDCTEPLHGIFPEETWSSFKTIAGFTAPVISSTITGETPEELGLKRNTGDFTAELNENAIDDMLFDHFDSYISLGRLIGPETRTMPLPPNRTGNFKFLPPIEWDAVSNWDPDIYRYFGMKWSKASPHWWDMIWYHNFITHGNFSIFDSKGHIESPEIKNGTRVMRRLARTDPDKLKRLYMQGVHNAVQVLTGLRDISDNNETIICFADHGESFGPLDGLNDVGHFKNMHKHDVLGRVPIWCNFDADAEGLSIPSDISNLTLKDWVVKVYKKRELNNPKYQNLKKKLNGKNG